MKVLGVYLVVVLIILFTGYVTCAPATEGNEIDDTKENLSGEREEGKEESASPSTSGSFVVELVKPFMNIGIMTYMDAVNLAINILEINKKLMSSVGQTMGIETAS